MVIFRKDGAVGQELFRYKNEIIETVCELNYLLYISSGGSFQKKINFLLVFADKALRAMRSIFSIIT